MDAMRRGKLFLKRHIPRFPPNKGGSAGRVGRNPPSGHRRKGRRKRGRLPADTAALYSGWPIGRPAGIQKPVKKTHNANHYYRLIR